MDTCKHPHLNLYNLIPCMALRPPTTLASQRLLWSILIGKLVVKLVLIHRILCLSCEHALVIVCVVRLLSRLRTNRASLPHTVIAVTWLVWANGGLTSAEEASKALAIVLHISSRIPSARFQQVLWQVRWRALPQPRASVRRVRLGHSSDSEGRWGRWLVLRQPPSTGGEGCKGGEERRTDNDSWK